MNYKDFYKQIQESSLSNLYLFAGSETYIAHSMLEKAIESLLSEEERAFNLVRLKSDQLAFSEFLNAIETLPFFGSNKVISVNCPAIFSSALWSDANLKEFKHRLDQEKLNGCHVFFLCDRVDGRNKFYKAFKSLGRIVECEKISHGELITWVQQKFASRHVKIDQKALKAFATHCGYLNPDLEIDLYHLESDINALSMEFKGGKIDEAVILQRFDNADESNVFKAIDAMFDGSGDALEKVDLLIKRGEPALKLLYMIHRHIRQLLGVKVCLVQKKSQLEIEQELGLKSFVAKKSIAQSGAFSLGALYELLHIANEMDFSFKNTALIADENAMLYLLIFQIKEKRASRV